MLQGDVPSGWWHEHREWQPTQGPCPWTGSPPHVPQALTLWPEEDPVAGLVAVRLSIVLCGAERETCHLGWGPGKIQSSGHGHLAGHLSHSAYPLQTPQHSQHFPRLRGCPALPSCKGSGCPWGWLGTSQPCPTGIPRCAGQASKAGTPLPRHGPLGSASCCSAHSVGRDGASPSPAKSPSRLEWDKEGGSHQPPAPC